MNIITWYKEVGLAGFLDIAIMALLIYFILVWFKKTRAAFILSGIIIAFLAYLLSRQFDLTLTAAVFEKFFAVILIAMVVIFQEELRRIFERIAVFGLPRRLRRKKAMRISRDEVVTLAQTLADLARERIGALVVIQGKDMLDRHLDGGVSLNGELSESLLKSLFDPHSAGHDGAVIIEDNRLTQFSCHLPLSKNIEKLHKGCGTRHTAALGLAELTDALCLVVSEERGEISIAHRGNIRKILQPDKLTDILEAFYQEINPSRGARSWKYFFRRNRREKMIAIPTAAVLWFVLVYSAETVQRTFTIPVTHGRIATGWKVAELEPRMVRATFRGPRRSFYFLKPSSMSLFLRLDMRSIKQKIRISDKNLNFPKRLTLTSVYPNTVRVNLDRAKKRN